MTPEVVKGRMLTSYRIEIGRSKFVKYDLVFRRYDKREVCLDTITLEVERECTKDQLVHYLPLIHLQIEIDFVIPKQFLVSGLSSKIGNRGY